jgi:hypothetical protein
MTLARHQRHVGAQAEMTEAGVEQKVAVSAAHMPDWRKKV